MANHQQAIRPSDSGLAAPALRALHRIERLVLDCAEAVSSSRATSGYRLSNTNAYKRKLVDDPWAMPLEIAC